MQREPSKWILSLILSTLGDTGGVHRRRRPSSCAAEGGVDNDRLVDDRGGYIKRRGKVCTLCIFCMWL
ncbi:hypothetical protein N9140_00165 [bacterium]|nr:hypothetical protein [bacterium]